DRRWSWLLTLHHVVFDGWSLGVLFGEVSALYRALAHGRPPAPPPLPPLPVQYGDYAHWQRERLRGERLDALLDFWRGVLAGAPTALELPVDRPRPPVQSHRGGLALRRLPEAATAPALAAGAAVGATPFTVFLATFAALLGRLGAGSDLVLGTPVAHRERPEVEGLIGFFVNTLVLRLDLAGDPSWRQAVERCQRVGIAALAHQELPFEKLVEALRPERRLDRAPLFQVAFVLHNAPEGRLELGDAVGRPSPGGGDALFDLSLELRRTEEGWIAAAEYARDLFDAATVERLLAVYETLLSAAGTRPDTPLHLLPLLDAGERRRLAAEAAGVEPALPETLHGLVAAAVRRDASAIAVEAAGERWTYGELAARAAGVAARLAAAGVGRGDRVGLLAERRPRALAGLLGVLAAGACWVPLDPRAPRRRLAEMAADAGLSAVLVDPSLAGDAADWGVPRVDLAAVDGAPPEPAADLAAAADPADLAYVLFTSGSSGRPKAVAVEHRSAATYAAAAARRFALAPGDRLLQFASFAFDTVVEEVFATLAAGATLVLRDDAMIASAERFTAAVAAAGITVLDLPTAWWHHLVDGLDAGGLELPEDVRLVVIGGEAAAPAHVARWRRLAPRARLLNTYGPTETTVVAAWGELDGAPEAGRPVAIGRAVPHARLAVVDRRGEAVPDGLPGELHVGGAGVARGYLGRPSATAERFRPDPLSPVPGGRRYATGDRVRRRPEGAYEFLGRLDDQVKVLGQRVEPAEVETVLAGLPEVAAAAVVARPAADGARLVGYAVPAAGGRPSEEALLAALRQALPPFMVPARVVVLAALPLTPQGKLDRAALPEPPPAAPRPRVAAASREEAAIAAVWQQVLGVAQVGRDDNFFDLGGTSLLLVQVHARLLEELPEAALSLLDLFRHPTVAALGERVGGGAGGAAGRPAERARERVGERLAARRRRDRREGRRRGAGDAERLQGGALE
ncbi:MAG TPA: amino acid adenylation domain-containing protein, partial [Thermoanaerobaculia bacterium]